MKKILFLCITLIVLCSCQSEEDKVINAFLSSMGETRSTAKENGVSFSDVKVSKIEKYSPEYDPVCLSAAQMILLWEIGGHGLMGSETEKYEDAIKEEVELREKVGGLEGYIATLTMNTKESFGNTLSETYYCILDQDLQYILFKTNYAYILTLQNIIKSIPK